MTAYLAISIGAYLVFGALAKPDFFWNSNKALRLRKSFGDQTAVKIYLGISAFAFIFGILDLINVF